MLVSKINKLLLLNLPISKKLASCLVLDSSHLFLNKQVFEGLHHQFRAIPWMIDQQFATDKFFMMPLNNGLT
jgi:hypothetical protein